MLGVAAIEASNLDVVAIYKDTFTSVTKKIAAVELEETKAEDLAMQEKYVFVVHTMGAFESAFKCEIENGLFLQIAWNLNKGQDLSEDMKVMYLTEYLNIICGRALSSINGKLGSRSKLTVPKYLGEADETQEEQYACEEQIGFATEYGNMRIDLKHN